MKKADKFTDAGNIKFRSAYRESMYFKMRDDDQSGLFSSISEMFYTAFAIGYHFDKQEEIAKKSINHVNLVSLDRDIKELMVRLILKRKGDIDTPKDLWKEVEKYAEYGIQVLFNTWKDNNNSVVVESILEPN